MKTIIAIFGNSRAGKTTIANMISNHVESRVINFADPVKEVAKVMVGVPLKVSHGSQSDKSDNYYYGKSARQILRWIGTEVGKDGISPTVWVDRFIDQVMMSPLDTIISGDGRFPDEEAHYLKVRAEELGVRVITVIIRRPSIPVDFGHRSESIIANTNDDEFDHLVMNTGTLSDLEDEINDLVDLMELNKSSGNREDFIRTYTGKKYFPLDPFPSDVDSEDIAHGLSKTDRWNRQAKCMVSVAYHSINVMKLVSYMGHSNTPLVMLYALLHDAHEAYLADVPYPVKRFIPWWKELEDKNDKAIFDHFGLVYPVPEDISELIRKADRWIAVVEGKLFTTHDHDDLGEGPPDSLLSLVGIDWHLDEDYLTVKKLFLHYLDNLLKLTKEIRT